MISDFLPVCIEIYNFLRYSGAMKKVLKHKEVVVFAVFALIFVIAFFAQSYRPGSQNKLTNQAASEQKQTESQQDGDDSKIVLGTFSGVFPCADCEGLETYLTLYHDPATGGATTYALKERYLGKNTEPFVETGTWDYLRGTPADPDATVYGLNLDKPKNEQQYYLKVGESEVRLLDSSMNEINSPMNFTLMKTE